MPPLEGEGLDEEQAAAAPVGRGRLPGDGRVVARVVDLDAETGVVDVEETRISRPGMPSSSVSARSRYSRRATAITWKPSAASRRAKVRPMPVLAPVTSAVCGGGGSVAPGELASAVVVVLLP
ncbi:hypothetical protein VR45_27870 [Streptomyces sp. NRRL S-495]|nr:hypothetical protein VR45_27870 [Streptomyces sp. NRRL S-495]